MFIIPFPWHGEKLENLRDTSDIFDLLMKDSAQQFYLIIQGDTITWIGQGSIPGQVAYHIKSRSLSMNGIQGIPEDHGNVGFFGKYSSIDDAILKLFPKNGCCVSNMTFTAYTGQKLKGKRNHYNVIYPILCLLSNQPSEELEHFFQVLGWGSRKHFHYSGTWNNNMKLFIDGCMASSLEEWFSSYCAIALG